MRFHYQARDAGGRVKSGEVTAGSRDEATRQLRSEGYFLLTLEEQTGPEPGGAAGAGLFAKRVSRSEVIYLTNQLSIMIDAGVSLGEALDGIAQQAESPALKGMLKALQTDVESGENLSAALARFPRQFDSTYINLVKASEASGALGPMLDRIALQARKDLETRQKVRGALTYPAGMAVMCVGVCVFLLTYVFPKLTPMFSARKLGLPAPTKWMMALSEVLVHDWMWVLLGLGVAGGGLFAALRQEWGRRAADWAWLRIPVLGPLARKLALARSMRTLATTLSAGVPMLEALELSAGVAGNSFFAEAWRRVAREVAAGKQICEVLAGHPLFPATLVQMISSGEQTGKLGGVLTKVSDYFDREVETSVKTATSMVEPIMVATMGGVIGFIALAMLLPIFKLSTSH